MILMSAVTDSKAIGTTGVIHIECRKRAGEPSEYYLVSFGGNKDGVGAFYLAKAIGSASLTALLRKLGVPGPTIETALRGLMPEPHHKIPNVTLTQAQMRGLGL